MINSELKYGIIIFIVLLANYFLNKGSRNREPRILNGSSILRMNKLYLVLGIFSCIVALFPLLSIFEVETNKEEMETIVFLFFIFSIPGTITILLWRNHFVMYDEISIEVSTIFGKINKIYWTEVDKVYYNSFSGYLNIINNKGQKIKLHHHLNGTGKFLEMMNKITHQNIKLNKLL